MASSIGRSQFKLAHLFVLLTVCAVCASLLTASMSLALSGGLLAAAFAVGQRWRSLGAVLFVLGMVVFAVLWLQHR